MTEPALVLRHGKAQNFGFVLTGHRKNYYSSSSSAPETAILMKRDAKLPLPVDLEKSCT